MQLHEISGQERPPFVVGVVQKLLDKHITVHLLMHVPKQPWWPDPTVKGEVTSIGRKGSIKMYHSLDLLGGSISGTSTKSTLIADDELETASLKKQKDGTYLLTVNQPQE